MASTGASKTLRSGSIPEQGAQDSSLPVLKIHRANLIIIIKLVLIYNHTKILRK